MLCWIKRLFAKHRDIRRPWYNRWGDIIEYCNNDGGYYAHWVDPYLTILYELPRGGNGPSPQNDKIVGVQLWGIKHWLRVGIETDDELRGSYQIVRDLIDRLETNAKINEDRATELGL